MNDRKSSTDTVVVDCDIGRRLGCRSFCCSMIVRLRPGERDPTAPDADNKSCLDKDPATGRCVHQDQNTGWCSIWADRPAVCREYDCNKDPMLQTVLRVGFKSLMQAAVDTAENPETGTPATQVPYVKPS